MFLLSATAIFPFQLRLFIWEAPPRPVLELADGEPPGLAYQAELLDTTLRGGPEGSAAHARAWFLRRALETVPELDPRSPKRAGGGDWVSRVVQAKRFTLEQRLVATIKAYHLRYAPHPWWDEAAGPWVRPLVKTVPPGTAPAAAALTRALATVEAGGSGVLRNHYDPLHPSERSLVDAPPCFQDPSPGAVTRELLLARRVRGGSKEYLQAVGRDLEKRKERLELICRALEQEHTPSRFDVSGKKREKAAAAHEGEGEEEDEAQSRYDDGSSSTHGGGGAGAVEGVPESTESSPSPARRLVWHDATTVAVNKHFQGPFFQEKPLSEGAATGVSPA